MRVCNSCCPAAIASRTVSSTLPGPNSARSNQGGRKSRPSATGSTRRSNSTTPVGRLPTPPQACSKGASVCVGTSPISGSGCVGRSICRPAMSPATFPTSECRIPNRRWTSVPGWMPTSEIAGYTFDPRNNQRRIVRVVIGRGRDGADVAMVTTFGRAELITMTVVAELADRDAEAVQKSNVHTAVNVD